MGMDYSLVQRIIDGYGKILDTKPGSPDEGTYVTEQQLADWIKGQTFVTGYYYNSAFYSDLAHTNLITPQANVLYADLGAYGLYAWDGAAYQPFTPDLSPYATKAEMQAADTNLNNAINQLDHRVQNIEQAKGDYVVQNYKDGSTTPSGKGAWAIVEGLRGVSRVENNLCNPVVQELVTYGVTYKTYADGKVTLVGTATTSFNFVICTVDIVGGHTYLLSNYGAKMPISATNLPNLQVYAPNVITTVEIRESATTNYALGQSDGTGQADLRLRIENGNTYNLEIYPFLTDMNVYFGGTIPSDADTIAEIQQNYPHLLTPSEYGVRIVDSSYSGVRAWGKNLVDIPTTTWASDGSKDFSIDIPIGTYTLSMTSSQARAWIAYLRDSDGVITQVSSASSASGRQSVTFTLTRKATTLTVYVNGATVMSDIQLEEGSSATAYSPYMVNTLSFPSTTLKSAGSVREKKLLNVEVEIDGQKVQKSVKTNPLGSYTFTGDETWTKRDSNVSGKSFYTTTLPIKNFGMSVVPNLLCLGFVAVTYLQTFQCVNGCGSTNGLVSIYDSAHDNITGSAFSAFMAGKTIYYELATPDPDTYSDPIIDNTLLTEAGGRMATVQTGTVVDGSFDMGFINL